MKNIITTLILVLLVSCGTRNVNKSETKTEVTQKDTISKLVTGGSIYKEGDTINLKEELRFRWEYRNGEIVPVDPRETMIIYNSSGDSLKILNGSLKFEAGKIENNVKSEKTEHNYKERKDSLSININSGSKTDVKQESKIKATTREGAASKIQFWIGLAVFAAIVIWFVIFIIRKRKQENA